MANVGLDSFFVLQVLYCTLVLSFNIYLIASFFVQNSNCIFVSVIEKSLLFRTILYLGNFFGFCFEADNLNFVQIKRGFVIGRKCRKLHTGSIFSRQKWT